MAAESKNYQKVKKYYDRNLWTKEMVHSAVGKWITKEEFTKITGEDYYE